MVSPSDVVAPVHTTAVPVMLAGVLGVVITDTVIVADVLPQVLLTVYDITELPTATPLTTPLLFTVAKDVLLLLQVPPVVVSPKDVTAPVHTLAVPVMVLGAVGSGLTVTVAVTVVVPQVFVFEKDITDVPAATPVTTPPDDTVAILVVVLVHVVLVAVSAKVVVLVGHTLNVPVIAGTVGSGFTVMVALPLSLVVPKDVVTLTKE